MDNKNLTDEKTVLLEPQDEAQGNVETAPKDKATGFKSWKGVMLGGIPGILLGVGGMFAAQGFNAQAEEHPIANNGGNSHVTVQNPDDGVEEIAVAHSPNDDMSFREAFETAREEVGPGGAFSWHGNVYSTYRSDDPEWVEMGPDGQAAHCHDIVTQVQAEPYQAQENVSEVEDTANDVTIDTEVQVSVDEMEDIDSGDVDVHIIGVESDPESGASAAYGYVDGHATVFLDEDGDGEIDVVLHDADDDGQVSDNEIVPVQGSGVSIDDLSQEIDTGNDVELYEGQPDYTNEVSPDYDNGGDISGF